MDKDKLSQSHCKPCEGGIEPLSEEEAMDYLTHIPEWQLADQNKKIKKQKIFEDFSEALDFVNKVGEIAEKEGHHPDILIHDYKKVAISLSTHAINGLSENDFILGSKIDELDKR